MTTQWEYTTSTFDIPSMWYFTDAKGQVHVFPSEKELNAYKKSSPKIKYYLSLYKNKDNEDSRVFIILVDEQKKFVTNSHYVMLDKNKITDGTNYFTDNFGIKHQAVIRGV